MSTAVTDPTGRTTAGPDDAGNVTAAPQGPGEGHRPDMDLSGSSRRNRTERLIAAALFTCAAASTLVTVGVVAVLLRETLGFFNEVPVRAFLTDTRWEPMFLEKHFGVLPLLAGSFMVAAGAAALALPVGLLTAIFLSEYAAPGLRRALKPMLEVLAGIPTVVYGYFALTFVTPALRTVFPETDIFNAASASIVVGIMIIPLVASISDDAMRSVPSDLREGAYALGASKLRVSLRIVFPAAISGIVASIVLAASRAVGETMIVLIAAGASPKLTFDPTTSSQTMTAFIGQTATGDIATGTLQYETIFAVGTLLFVMTLAMNLVAIRLVRRFREVYE